MMIYHQPGEEFWHEGVCYKVGGRIVANKASDYAGLFGNILEIRTEADPVSYTHLRAHET